jgi:hypothetical protein
MPTTSGPPYALRLPQDGDLADVPQDLANLATDVAAALNTKMQKTEADLVYQAKITIVTGTAPPTTAGYPEGAIIFVVS